VAPQAVDVVLLAVLAVFIQAIAGHKFLGWGLMVIYIVTTLTFVNLGFEHNLYNYGGVPEVPTSDMNRLGKFWVGAWWFRLYWSAFAVGLVVLTYALWRRGTETRFWPRLRRLPSRLTGKAGLTFTVAAVVIIAAGVFIYVNTNVWNVYRTKIDDEKWQADYEKTLLRFENTPQPKITAMKLDVDLYPHDPGVNTKGVYFCCKHGIPHLLERGGGSVINVASFVAILGAATSQISYSASKGAVLSMSRELAVQFARQGIRVNSLCPGPVETPLLLRIFGDDPAALERRRIHWPMGRLAKPREVVNGALFLASDESSYVNGTSFLVDGGLTAAYVTPE
jgi:NAD(P)-dependent dehydrogenase (short-subunit alcohol dehydrogenase family)